MSKAQPSPSANGTPPAQRTRVRHKATHSPPTTISAAPRHGQGRFSPLPPTYQLDDVFCVYLRRRVGDDGAFLVDGVPYRVTRGLGYRGWAGIELGVRVIPSRSVAAFYQGELIEEFPLETPRPADLSAFRRAAAEG